MLGGDGSGGGRLQQVEDISADSGGIGVPARLPVTVDLPRNAREAMAVPGGPLADRGMRGGKARIGAEMGGGGHPADGQLRAVNPVIAVKRSGDLRTDLDGSGGVEIHGHVTARAREAGGADERPDLAAGGGTEFGEVFWFHATAHHGEGSGDGVGQGDGVGHSLGMA